MVIHIKIEISFVSSSTFSSRMVSERSSIKWQSESAFHIKLLILWKFFPFLTKGELNLKQTYSFYIYSFYSPFFFSPKTENKQTTPREREMGVTGFTSFSFGYKKYIFCERKLNRANKFKPHPNQNRACILFLFYFMSQTRPEDLNFHLCSLPSGLNETLSHQILIDTYVPTRPGSCTKIQLNSIKS